MNTTDLIEFTDKEEWDGYYQVVECKRALSPSGLPEIDYALNPYGGCEHGCVYCYAPEVLHTEWKDWRVVKVRTNIADRLAKELVGLSGTVGIGTVTDPYQYAEKRFLLTRSCLEVLKAKD
ncbi:MAG: radical SAM protein, partial [Candidatus Methanoplasma sp.]|nr:radical SAM protein [Candidatus Methanoplasma sp.]